MPRIHEVPDTIGAPNWGRNGVTGLERRGQNHFFNGVIESSDGWSLRLKMLCRERQRYGMLELARRFPECECEFTRSNAPFMPVLLPICQQPVIDRHRSRSGLTRLQDQPRPCRKPQPLSLRRGCHINLRYCDTFPRACVRHAQTGRQSAWPTVYGKLVIDKLRIRKPVPKGKKRLMSSRGIPSIADIR